mmetsp:Transcript_40032/g.33816  ORF Transcript_40032/g.33816 Transcript_40032/m.33816 type:complete len:131 (-) Transcript_40032:297-689(-)
MKYNIIFGSFIYILIHIICTLSFIPGLILTFGAGVVYKQTCDSLFYAILFGSIVVSIGASIGAYLSFILGRYVLQDSIKQLATTYPLINTIQKVIKRKGLLIICLLRICPFKPFCAINYLMGSTEINELD